MNLPVVCMWRKGKELLKPSVETVYPLSVTPKYLVTCFSNACCQVIGIIRFGGKSPNYLKWAFHFGSRAIQNSHTLEQLHSLPTFGLKVSVKLLECFPASVLTFKHWLHFPLPSEYRRHANCFKRQTEYSDLARKQKENTELASYVKLQEAGTNSWKIKGRLGRPQEGICLTDAWCLRRYGEDLLRPVPLRSPWKVNSREAKRKKT